MNPHVVIFDGNNFLHRSRSGFLKGEWAVAFNFFRALRAEVEKHEPTRVIFTLDGTPKRQIKIDPDYKANRRVVETDPEKIDSYASFLNQKATIVRMLKDHFPIAVMKHEDFEADDLIANLVKRSTRAVPITVISTDTDFIQLLTIPNVKVYNPVKKSYFEPPSYDYVVWKALRGDTSDNVPKIVNEKQALEIVTTEAKHAVGVANVLSNALNLDELDRFKKNLDLIRFHEFTEEETFFVRSWQGSRNWSAVKSAFEMFAFKSITNDRSWTKFTATFDHLWEMR